MKKDKDIILIQSGNQSMFATIKEGETVILGDPATFMYSGTIEKENQKEIEEDSVSLVKKLKRRIKKK